MTLKYPHTTKKDIVDEIHGKKIVDPYRWLEDSTSEEVQNWITQQNEFTNSLLQQYSGEERIKKRLKELFTYDYIMANYFQVTKIADGPRFFYYFRKANEDQPSLCYQDGEDGERITLYNPLEKSDEGIVAIDWFVPSHDGSYVAFGISEGGTEMSVLHIMEVESKKLLDERITQTKWCDLVWYKNNGFFYSRYPLPGTVSPEDEHYYHHVYYHKIGDDYRDDVKIFGEGRPKTEHPSMVISDDYSLLSVCSYRFISSDIHVAAINPDDPASLEFIPVIENDEAQSFPYFSGNELFVLTQLDAPNGRIIKYDLSDFKKKQEIPEGTTVVPESDGVIFGVEYPRVIVFGDKLATVEMHQASSSLKIYNKDSGELVDDVDFGTHVTIYQIASAPGLNTFYFGLGSFFYPASHYRYTKDDSKPFYTPELELDPDRFQSTLEWYESKDGTNVSMFLLSKRGVEFSEKTPVTLTGYGGFGISLTPSFSPVYIAWLEQGGVIALPHLRGGGEYGQAWHRAGNRESKQNVFDDFIYAAKWLADNKIGSSNTISIRGGSNGGLLVGAALVQSPESFACVACHVPLLDMIRYTNFSVAKTWASEYGDPDNEEEFGWLFSYSPYHHVKEGVKYPATFLHTALGDTRVDSMHAFKMAAKMQSFAEEVGNENPLVLYVESKTGHGAGTPIEKTVDLYTKALVFQARHTGLKIE